MIKENREGRGILNRCKHEFDTNEVKILKSKHTSEIVR